MIMFGIMLILAGIIMLITAIALAVKNRAFSAGSENTMATIVRKSIKQQKRGSIYKSAYEFGVSYFADGIEYKNSIYVDEAEYRQLEVGDKVEIMYRTAKPKDSVRAGEINRRAVPILWIITVILLVAGVALFLIGRG